MQDELLAPQPAAQQSSVERRLVYVMPSDCLVVPDDAGGGLSWALSTIWRRKWIVVIVTLVFTFAGVSYALLSTEWFRAETTLAASDKKSMPDLLGSLGGLASLAGVAIGGGGSDEPVAMLKSREFTRAFITDNQLLTVLLAKKWDPSTKRWRGDPEEWPDIRDAVEYFDKYVRNVSVDKKTGIVTLSIRWTDPEVAADWANQLVKRLNDRMRQRALIESERNVKFLQAEISANSTVSLQQSIARVLETEMQRLMLARGNLEFSFRVIDPATPPRKRSEPKRAQICIIATLLGFAFSIVGVLGWAALPQRERATTK